MKNQPRIEIKFNNCATNDPCAICGARTDPIVGPEFFLAGTWALVCEDCVQYYAPSLLRRREKMEGFVYPPGEFHAADFQYPEADEPALLDTGGIWSCAECNQCVTGDRLGGDPLCEWWRYDL